MIKIIGMKAMPAYPSTSPVIANPLPCSRPALFLMSDREMCPKTIAAMAVGRAKKKIPRIRLAIAFPLVRGGSVG
jgi:hypothetical protein